MTSPLTGIECDAPMVREIAKRICFAGDVTCQTCIANSLQIVELVRRHDFETQDDRGR
jgi:hypothetical protein